jgi:hypothetical protein
MLAEALASGTAAPHPPGTGRGRVHCVHSSRSSSSFLRRPHDPINHNGNRSKSVQFVTATRKSRMNAPKLPANPGHTAPPESMSTAEIKTRIEAKFVDRPAHTRKAPRTRRFS